MSTDKEKLGIIPVETTITRKQPGAQRQVFTDDEQVQFQPFRYQEGQSVIDAIAQARQHKSVLDDKEQRTARMAKMAGWTNFLSALANLAGGGYTQTRHQHLPIVQQSLSQLSNIQDEKYKSDLYYQELARKIKQEDYQNQLKNHIEQQEKLATLNQNRKRENNRSLNSAASDEFNANVSTVQEKGITQFEADRIARDQAIRQQSANASTTSANASMARATADKTAVKKNNFLVYTDPSGKQRSMGKSQAQQIINDVASRHKGLETKPDDQLTPLEKSIKDDISNMNRAMGTGNFEATDNLIRAVALKYLKDGYSEFQHYFDSEDTGVESTDNSAGSFLPRKSVQQKKNLLEE